jgi:ABC-2 type transport system permease protein
LPRGTANAQGKSDGRGAGKAKRFWFYTVTARMSIRRNLQYRGQHMINNVASAVFGFIYIAIWQAASASRPPVAGYDAQALTHYIVLCQSLLWITTFDRSGIQLAQRVRDGSVGTDLMRPVDFMGMHLAQIYGVRLYNFAFRSLPVAAIFALTVGVPAPGPASRLLLIIPSWVLAMHVGAVLNYLIGLAGFWTVETGWLYLTLQTLVLMLGGCSLPLDLMPAAMRAAAGWLPFACAGYYPAALYLGRAGFEVLLIMAGWAVALWAFAAWLTARARMRAEVAGG